MGGIVINPILLSLMSVDSKGKYVTVTELNTKDVRVAIDEQSALIKTIKRSEVTKLHEDAFLVGSKWYISAEGTVTNVVAGFKPEDAKPVKPKPAKVTSGRSSGAGSLPVRSNSKLNS